MVVSREDFASKSELKIWGPRGKSEKRQDGQNRDYVFPAVLSLAVSTLTGR